MYEDIAVTSFYYAGGNVNRSFPRRIETGEGRQINFLEEGLRCVIQKGQKLLQVFTMSDGEHFYRLMFEPAENTWKLLGIRNVNAV